MKKLIAFTVLTVLFFNVLLAAKPIPCGTYNGKNLYKGTKGGCYYLKTKKKVKVYVDKTLCKCK